jgi:pimeloyl-ACP methyl ester carboxylesterase
MLKKLAPILVALSLLLTSCQPESAGADCPIILRWFGACQAAPTASPGSDQSGYTPKYEKANCPFDKVQGVTVDCGYLTVPEDRTNPKGATIRIAVARYKAALPNPASDPIVYLEGGPGGSPLRAYTKSFSALFGPFNQKRDVILVDQRGTGYSEPALDCPEITQLTLDQLNQELTPEATDVLSNKALQACHDRLKSKGINLSAYTSAANAADLNDLRIALGIKEWNLYGISYGTRLALTALRDTPTGIRSVAIDSVYPPQTSLVTDPPASFSRSINLVFETCAADPACNSVYPNLKQVLLATVKKLNASPAKITLVQPDLGNIGTPGKKLDAVMDGKGLLSLLFQVLYGSELLPSVPALIYQANAGDFGIIAQLQSQMLAQLKDISQGMYNSVECYEEIPFDTLANAEAAYQAQGELSGAFGTAKSSFDSCQIWNVPQAPAIENQAVKSNIPTLVLSGHFDPITPPDWGKLAAGTLSKSFFFEVPTGGHGSSLTVDCPQQMVVSFFDQPTSAPNSSCLSGLKLTYSVPITKMTVKLGPFDNRLMGFSGLVPAEWKQAGSIPGFYTPDGSQVNSTQLLMQAAQMSSDQFLSLMETQLTSSGIALVPSTRKYSIQSAGGLKWSFYEADGGLIKVDMALASSGKKTYVVLLQSPWNQREALVNAVLIPLVEALIGQ